MEIRVLCFKGVVKMAKLVQCCVCGEVEEVNKEISTDGIKPDWWTYLDEDELSCSWECSSGWLMK